MTSTYAGIGSTVSASLCIDARGIGPLKAVRISIDDGCVRRIRTKNRKA